MNFIEAMRKIDNDGCKIRRKIWHKDIFIVSKDRIILEKDGSLSSAKYNFDFNDCFADDWEEYTTVKDEKLHTFEKALTALKSGATIKRKDYVIMHKITHYNFLFEKSDILANDWVIIKEEV